LHRQPTPRLGGIAVLAGIAAGLPLGLTMLAGAHSEVFEHLRNMAVILTTATFVCVVGIRDDVRPLSPVAKLTGLAVAGVLLSLGGVRIEWLDVPWLGKWSLGPLAGVATVFWVLACTNAVNLIDGVDGLGAGVAAVACGALALVAHGMGDPSSAVAFLVVGGACAGFLLHNREPARLFLGDSGSLLLGFLLAAISAHGCTKRTTAIFLVAALLTLAVPLLDSTQAFVRRLRRACQTLGRGRWLAKLRAVAVGDREHVHHRLLGRGLSHRQVTRTLCLCALVPGTSALLLLPHGATGLVTALGAAAASALVLWRLAAMPSTLKAPPAAAEKDLVLPSRPPRRAPRAEPTRQHETV
jgi:UDP-GlcNAc:undecaprenyl-phosphate GlcNAc-1-phosphate transferase